MRNMSDPFKDRHPIASGAFSVALLLGAIACWLAIGGGQALAAQVKCGDTITADTTLHKNLVNCPNNGIEIGADNITLDLNGHTIDGDGTPSAGCDPATEFCDVGVVNFGHDGVTVMHGSLRQFGGGVDFGEVRRNRLLGLSTPRNAGRRHPVLRLLPNPGPRVLRQSHDLPRGHRDRRIRLASRPHPEQLLPGQSPRRNQACRHHERRD